MKTAIGYIRISKKDQSVYSLDDQEMHINEYCKRHELELLASFRDDGESSYTFDRPDYLALEAFIKKHKGKVHYLLIVDHDRFSRNISEALAKITHLEKKYGVKVLALNEPLNLDTSDPTTFLNRAFKYLMANHELLNIRKRTRNGLRRAIMSGRVVNNAPFGYRNVRDEQGKPTLAVDEDKAHIIRRIFEQFVSGVSVKLLMKEARQSGLKHSGNSACTKIIRNSVYAGLLRLPGENGEPERMIKALHTPIVSEHLYWNAQSVLLNRPQYKVRANENFPLRGVVRCTCGRKLTASFNKGKLRYYMYYSCPKHRNLNYNGEALHERILQILAALSFSERQVDTIKKYCIEAVAQDSQAQQSQLRVKQKLFEEVLFKMEKLEENVLNDVIDARTYKKWYAKLSKQRASLEVDINGMQVNRHDIVAQINKSLPYLTDMRTLYTKINLQGKQTLLYKVFEQGIVCDGKRVRTPKINPALMHNYNKIKEKGLLDIEQPNEISDNLERCTA